MLLNLLRMRRRDIADQHFCSLLYLNRYYTLFCCLAVCCSQDTDKDQCQEESHQSSSSRPSEGDEQKTAHSFVTDLQMQGALLDFENASIHSPHIDAKDSCIKQYFVVYCI